MDLADCTTPEKLLSEIYKLQKGIFPLPVPVREWALALDIAEIRALDIEGFEGGLIMFHDRSSGSILVNQAAHLTRQRFTIGHELGHFLLPWHTPRHGQGFLCSSKDMAIFDSVRGFDRYMEMEAQANKFSAGLLMPTQSIRADLRAHPPFGIAHIVEMSRRYGVSKEAMARRCVELHDESIAVVLSRNGVMIRHYRGRDFPPLCISNGAALPSSSTVGQSVLAVGEVSAWDELEADCWLARRRGSVSEQAIGQQNGFRMTLLTYEGADDGEDDAGVVECTWRAPQFRKG